MSTKKTIIQKATAMLVVIIMMIANFSVVGGEVIAYAAEAVETNNKNVEIAAYFEDANGEKVDEVSKAISSTDLKLKVEVTVKNDEGLGGYFDGDISIEDGNFKIKDGEGTSIHVNAGNTETIEIGIEYNSTETLTEDYLSEKSTVKVTGTYKNSKKEYDITGTTKVTVNWISSDEAEAKLKATVLTNKQYEINGENTNVVQLLIRSKLSNNEYPIKNTQINVEVPEGIEDVTVHKRVTTATNSDDEIDYTVENGILTINISNEEDILKWENGEDDIVVTFKFSTEDIKIENIGVNSKISTYDGKELKAEENVTIDEEKDGIITGEIKLAESSIYKGKIYTGEDRTYNTTTKINVDNVEIADKIELKESETVYIATSENGEEEKDANITYVKTEINKAKFIEIFGEEGTLTIKDQNGNEIATINNESETNEEGNIVIGYNGTTSITVETSKPVNTGILELNHQKKISNDGYSREERELLTGIKEKIEIRGNETTKTIELKETETKANLEVETTSLSTTEEGQELKLRVTLDTSDESKELYTDPNIKITLPEDITVTQAKYKVLYGNGLEGNGATVTTEDGKNVIAISLKGEQTSYSGEAINGTIIDIIATVDVDNLATSKTGEIKLSYSNKTGEGSRGTDTGEIKIVSESTMILTNNAEEAGVTTQGSDETKEVSLEVDSDATEETIDMQIINNEGADLTDVTVMGELPTSEGNISLASEVETSVDATVYYTEQEDATTDLTDSSNEWTEEASENATNYLISIQSLSEDEGVEVSYTLAIAEDLEYNVEESESYKVEYTNSETSVTSTALSSTLLLTTGTSAVLGTELTATVGNETLSDGDEVNVGEIITYEYTVTNSGKEDAEGVNITATVPNGTTLVEINGNYYSLADEESVNYDDYYLEKEDTEVKYENVTIKAEETLTYTYMVKINAGIEDRTETTESVSLVYEDETDTKTITHVLKAATLSVQISRPNRTKSELTNVYSGYTYTYQITVTNISDSEQKNIQVSINGNDLITIVGATLYKDETNTDLGAVQSLTIDSLAAGESASVTIDGFINQATENLNSTSFYVTVTDESDNTYTSEEISENVIGVEASIELASTTTSENTTGYVYVGDTITYTIKVKNTGKQNADSLVVRDMFSSYLVLKSITLDGEELAEGEGYSIEYVFGEEDEEIDYNIIEINTPLNTGESAEIVITAEVDEILTSETMKVRNQATANSIIEIAETDEIMYYIEATTTDGSGTENGSDSNSESSESSSEGTDTYSISGTVWIDEDGNGSKDSDEGFLEGITVYAIDVESNETKGTATTNSEGLYTLSGLEEGSYIVVFEYDTLTYLVTTYQADGISDSKNSDAVKASMEINGERKEVAATDSIEINSSVANIDLGLIEAQVFDLDIQKFVSKITVTNNSGTTTYAQDDGTTLAQVQIASAYLDGSAVSIEYTIRITNNGEVAGYAKSIVDYLPSTLSFSSSLNSDWYQSGDYIYNSSLANTKIEPGESQDITLVLTKTMTSSNTGLINNEAEIYDSYNSLGITESDKEDTGSAEVILGIKTGAAVSYVLLTLTIIIVICGVAYLVNKKILKSKIDL